MNAFLRQLRRAIAWHRRSIAAAAAVLAVLATVAASANSSGPSVVVLVATRELRAGTFVAAEDVRVSKAPASVTPEGALGRPDEIVGRMLAASVAKGGILTQLSPVSQRVVSAGRTLLPVRLADPDVRKVVRPGDRITLISAGVGDSPARVVAEDVLVVALPTQEAEGAFSVPRGEGSLLLVDVAAGAVTAVVKAAPAGLTIAFA